VALQTFTAGQVLTAAQVTALQANDYNQTVNNYTDSRTLTIADLGDRVVMNKATATTITVNTGIFAAGDTLWIHNIGAGVCTITAGTATVSTSGSLALAQNAGGTLYFTSTGAAIFFPTVASSAQGLTLINTTSFSAVASQAINNVFSSTYDNYCILTDLIGSTTLDLNIRLRVGGVDNSSAVYTRQYLFANNTTVSAGRATTNTFWSGPLVNATPRSASIIELFGPFLTRVTGGSGRSLSLYNGNPEMVFEEYGHNSATSFDGFSLIASTGTITGTVSVYGYNK
jgi:hypothetical protein